MRRYSALSGRGFGPSRILDSYGGVGAGPGEFRALYGAWPRGDTIEAYDYRLRRMTRIAPDGGISTHALLAARQGYAEIVPGTLGEGWAGFAIYATVPGRDTIQFSRIDLDGTNRGEVAELLGMVRNVVGSGPEPLSPRSVQLVRNDHLFVAETLTPTIRVLNASGTLVREISLGMESPFGVADAWDLALQEQLSRSSSDAAESIRQRFASLPMPASVPIFANFIVDELGFLWVLPYDPSRHSFTPSPRNTGAQWRIFSAEGAATGSITLPADLDPTYITRDAVVGVRRDELDVESVHVYGLRRG